MAVSPERELFPEPRRPRVVVAHVVGARPNYMKVAPVYAALERGGLVHQRLIHTGQHYDRALSGVFFEDLGLPEPHVKLEVGSGTHAEQTARALVGLERAFMDMRPDLVVVPGDVNSTLAGALAAVKLQIPVCHLEAGLRSFDDSMPEEHNRRVADSLSALLLTHSEDANENLMRESVPARKIAFVGNTMIDTLMANVEKARGRRAWSDYGLKAGEYVLVTLHRAALVDSPVLLTETLAALERVARKIPVVFPMHPRTRARLENLQVSTDRVKIVDPLSYPEFLSLETGATAVITDSGGVQEETTALKVPCFTFRDNTERPVTITCGSNMLLGLNPETLLDVPALLERRRPMEIPPLWDGSAGVRAARMIERSLGVGLAVVSRGK
jgi:UDP-N-acetylglucosamine 2-epimerase (non-hydrolysing)